MTSSVYEQMFEVQKDYACEMLRNWQRLLALPRVPERMMRVRVGTTPHETIYKEGTLKVLHYQNDSVRYKEPVLVCYALVNRPYILDLQPERSVIRQLLKRGFPVYMIDWGVPLLADRSLGLNDYVNGLLAHVMDRVVQHARSEVVNLLGYCMGGAMSAMYTALHPERIKNLALMAAPIDFSGEETLLHLWTKQEYFDVDRLIEAYGNCPANLLQGAFQMMKPVANYLEKPINFWENVTDDHYLENFFAMERWGQDNIPVAGETFREFVKYLYQQNQLVKGEFRLGGKTVSLASITCPLLLLVAKHDHLVPPASTYGIEPHVRSSEVKKMMIDAGHVGLAVSSKAHKQFWPEATQWIAERSTAA